MKITMKRSYEVPLREIKRGTVVEYDGMTCMLAFEINGPQYKLVNMDTGRIIEKDGNTSVRRLQAELLCTY